MSEGHRVAVEGGAHIPDTLLHRPSPLDGAAPRAGTRARDDNPLADPSVAAAVLGEAPPMYVADARGRLVLATPALRALASRHGTAPLEHSPLIAEALGRLLDGEGRVELEHFLGPDGSVGPIGSVHRRQVGDDGRVQLVGVFADADDAANAKSVFLSKVNHDLRTPLNAIIGFSEMPLSDHRGALQGRYRSYFDNIRHAARDLLGTIENILSVVDGPAEAPPAELRPVAAAEALAAACAARRAEAEAKGVTLSIDPISPELRARADAEDLPKILDELIGNAIKFTARGGRIGLEAHRGARGTVDLAVRDTGIGIPAAERTRIFESFHQVAADLYAAPREGSGLGLTIARRRAQAMGGELLVDSRPGSGSRFVLRLPAA